MNKQLLHNGTPLEYSISTKDGFDTVRLNGLEMALRLSESASGRLLISNADRSWRARVVREKDRIYVWLDGRSFEFMIPSSDGEGAAGEEFSRDEVHAPMPGTVIKIAVKAGDKVAEGQTVVVVEAMKMEHNLKAPRAGVVARINAQMGKIVDTDTALIVLEEAS